MNNRSAPSETTANAARGLKRSNSQLRRERLLNLDEGQPILVAEAPSGYGKTCLARTWLTLAPQGTECIYISLGTGSSDPTAFIDQLSLSLTGGSPKSHEVPFNEDANRAEAFAKLAEKLNDCQQPLWLILDDAHHLANSPSRTYLQRLLQGANERLRIFITMQPTSLDVGLGNLTAQDKVRWINAETLAMTRREIEGLAKLRGIELETEQLDWLLQATEGWPALVQLALATPLERKSIQSKAVTVSGPLREYIYERFLTRLDSSERDALWTLACVGSAPLSMLRSICADEPEVSLSRLSTLGIVQDESHSGVQFIRLHPLVREAALRLLATERGHSKRQHQLAAAQWYLQQGYGAEAVGLLLDIGSDQLKQSLATLIDLAPRLIFNSGQHYTLFNLVERWEQVAQRSDPTLDSMAAWALIFMRRFDEANTRIARCVATGTELLQKAVIAALQDDYESGGRLAFEWLDQSNHEASFYTGAAWTVHGFNLKCVGDIVGAKAALFKAHTAFSKVQSSYGTTWAYLVGALALIKSGRHRDALAEIERGHARLREAAVPGSQNPMLIGIEAFLRYERNELSVTRSVLNEALHLLPEQGIVDTIILGFTAAARLRAAEGDLGSALDILAEGERCGSQREFQRLSLSLAAERALLLVRSGATSEAIYTLKHAGIVLERTGSSGVIVDRAIRLHARIALAEGDHRRVRDLVAPLLLHARSAQQRYKLCELLMLQALAEDLSDNEKKSFDMVHEALELGSAESYMRLFLDEGAELYGLLRRWLASKSTSSQNRPETNWARGILAIVDHVPSQTKESPAGLIEPLNKRELQILSLLDHGLSNAEIGARCFVVEGTVKWHLHNLYGKLGVRSRTAALRAARALELINA